MPLIWIRLLALSAPIDLGRKGTTMAALVETARGHLTSRDLRRTRRKTATFTMRTIPENDAVSLCMEAFDGTLDATQRHVAPMCIN